MTLTLEKIKEAMELCLNTTPEPPVYVISPQAWDMGLKILAIRPNQKLYGEWHIWAVAKEMGLV